MQGKLALRLYASGWRLIDIAREIGCTAPMVDRMAREGRHLDGKPLGWEPRDGQLTILEQERILTSCARRHLHRDREGARPRGVDH